MRFTIAALALLATVGFVRADGTQPPAAQTWPINFPAATCTNLVTQQICDPTKGGACPACWDLPIGSQQYVCMEPVQGRCAPSRYMVDTRFPTRSCFDYAKNSGCSPTHEDCSPCWMGGFAGQPNMFACYPKPAGASVCTDTGFIDTSSIKMPPTPPK